MEKIYYNYHKHDHKGNVRSLDVIVKLEDYCKRAIELGHKAIFTTNHGMQGDIFEATSLAHQYGLKLIVGCECYYVTDRHEKDRSNNHLIVIALNDSGVRQLNKILSIANEDGYYYKPRIDCELLMSLNPNDFVITTACVAGILKNKDLVLELYKKFGNNFLLEIQNHNEDIQKEFNLLALQYNKEYGIKLIHGNDSHYINKEDSKYRNIFLKAKGIIYEEEGNFILDYPDYDVIVERYLKQGILNINQIDESIQNTLIFDKAENLTIINDDIKLPSISNNPNLELKQMIVDSWSKEKANIETKRIDEYENSIRYEMDIIEKTKMEDYFIIDNKISSLAQSKYGAKLTNTGRGSAPSFYINKLLGLTDIDRLDSPCTLFPTRFMSVERILGAKSLPDIDLNTSDREPFIKATKELLGEENCAWMLAWKPLQESSGFRLYCKGIGMNISEYDNIAKDIDNYRNDKQWKDIIEESKHFVGVVESMSESPCSMLLYDKSVAEEIGLIKVKDTFCCLLDGYNCDKYKYLKNDYLAVKVWAIIKDACDLIGINIPTIKELNNLLDDKVWDIYSNGLTCTINQADSDFATGLVKKYKPRSVLEGSQWVAIIRPGCASLLNDFLDRKPYTTGVKELDDLLEDSGHRMIFQESIMKYLIWLGIDEPESYDIIKKIAKKKFKEKELEELKNKLEKGWINQVGRLDGFEATWIVVQQASKYSFNSSHSLSYFYDSLYGAYLKSHFPLEYYSVVFNYYLGDEERTIKLTEELNYFNINLKTPKFRYSSGKYMPSKLDNSIYKGIGSIKFLNEQVGNELYSLKNNQYNNFLELLLDILGDKTTIDARQLDILIKIGFFSEFGGSKYLLDIVDVFNNIYCKKQFKKDNIPVPLTIELLKKYSDKETEKLFKEVRINEMFKEVISTMDKSKDISLSEIFKTEIEFVGYISYINPSYNTNVVVITDIKTNKFGTPFATLYWIYNGSSETIKVDKRYYSEKPLSQFDVILTNNIEEKHKKRKVDGKWVNLDETEKILCSYGRVIFE